jgi:hypothetical protein
MSDILAPGVLMLFLPFSIYLMRMSYKDSQKEMIKAGHTAACSDRIASKAMWYQGQYSDFQVDVSADEIHPQGDYGTAVNGIFFISLILFATFIAVFAYAGDAAKSIFWPIIFTSIIIAISRVMYKVKPMGLTEFVICIVSLAMMCLIFALYLLNIIAEIQVV